MVDDDGERLDWGNDDDEQQLPAGSYTGYSPRQSYAGVPEDAEDAVSLGGDDDEDERDYFTNHSAEQGSPTTGVPTGAKPPSSASHFHPNKRDTQRLSATAPSRTPSRAKKSESPTRESRPPNSAGKPPPAPLMHALPPKPVLVPPLFEQPSEPGTLASAMVNRPRKANGASKGLPAPDGGDPLPPDWEIRYPRNGGKDAYYYNVKTEESTWTRPRLPASGRASPAKNRENGSAQAGVPLSPDAEDDPWPERTRHDQQTRPVQRDTFRRVSSPPRSDLSYQDRHYRPGETPTPANPGVWRADRGPAGSYLPESSYGRARSVSPQSASDGRRRTRSSSPHRGARRDLTQSPPPMWRESHREIPQDRQTGISESGWSRSQEFSESAQSASRELSTRHARRKDDIELPIRRRKDDIDSATRRKDDIEPHVRRKGDIEPPLRRKDDIEHRIRHRDDIEPPLRRKDDIEPPLRSLPSRDTSSRHVNDEWPAPRPRSPPPQSRDSSPPRRPGHPSLGPPNIGYLPPGSRSMREPSRYERPDDLAQERSRDNRSIDGLPQRRVRDVELLDPGFDNSKRRRLNDDSGVSRRGPADLLVPAPSLPTKLTATADLPETSPADQSQRRRVPLPSQLQQWRNSKPTTGSLDYPNLKLPIRIPSPEILSEANWVFTLPDGQKVNYSHVNMMPPGYRGQGIMPVYDTPSGYISRLSGWTYPEGSGSSAPPSRPGGRNTRTDFSGQQNNSGRGARDMDAMDVDAPPPFRGPPAPRVEVAHRGGMYSDRMPAPTAEGLPRAPRAMVPRDGGVYSLPPSTTSPPSLYDARSAGPPNVEASGTSSARGRGRPNQHVSDRRWEMNDTGRRPGYPAPGPIEPPPQQPRGLPERPSGRVPDVEQHGPRGRPPIGNTRPPTRMTDTNIPAGARPLTYDVPKSIDAPPPPRPFQTTDNEYEPRRQYGAERGEAPDLYGKRMMRNLPLPEQRPRPDRGDRRPSVTAYDSMRGRGAPEIEDRIPFRDDASARQSRFGARQHSPSAPPDDAGRVWLTREETQAPRVPGPRMDDSRVSREARGGQGFSRRVDPPHRQYHSPARDNAQATWGSTQFDEDYARPPPTLSSVHAAPSAEPPRRDRAATPPPHLERRQDGSLLPERPAVKVHPDRARFLATQAPSLPNSPERSSKPVRIRRPGPDRTRDFEDERGREVPPQADVARMGPPPREHTPPPQGGLRPNMKRGGSLLERLNIHDSPPHDGASSLRDRVDVIPQDSIESMSSVHAEPIMDMDNEGLQGHGGEDMLRGGGNGARGAGKKRHGKFRRGRRNGGGP